MYDLVVIGAGPSGVSLASEAIATGMDKEKVLILEKADKNSWIMRKLYPDQKLVTANFKGLNPDCHGVMKFYNMQKHEALEVLDASAKKYEINIQHGTSVLKVEKKGDSFLIQTGKGDFESKYVAVAIGIFGKPNKPDYPMSVALRKKTSFDITSSKIENTEVLVVGGGDSASEYVQYLKKDGNKLSLSCREESYFRMNPDNQGIIEGYEKEGELQAYKGSDVESIEEEGDRIKVNFHGDIESKIYDHIVYALGGSTPANFLKIAGVEFDDKGTVLVGEDLESNVKGLYLIGDLTVGKGGGSIVLAFNSGYNAMNSIKEKYGSELGL